MRHLLTRIPLTLQDTLQRTYSEQRPKVSLSKIMHFRFCFLYLEHRNISKLVRLMQDANALLSLRFFASCAYIASIIKKEEGFRFYTKFPFIILSN
jgi:hypothetical protein